MFRYHTAIISFCTSLTGADASDHPLGAFLVGEKGGEAIGVLAVLDRFPGDPPDALMGRMLESFPDIMRRKVLRVLNSSSSAGPLERAMDILEDSLRNTFYVSEIERNLVARVETQEGMSQVDSMFAFAEREAMSRLQRALDEAQEVDEEALEDPTTEDVPRVSTHHVFSQPAA